jgi:hypothetical protein
VLIGWDTLGKAYVPGAAGSRLRADGGVLLWRPGGLFARGRGRVIVASRAGHAALALAALAVALMPLWASGYHVQLASTALVAAMFALSLQLLVGAAGMVSLGHAAFFGIGATPSTCCGGPPILLTCRPRRCSRRRGAAVGALSLARGASSS